MFDYGLQILKTPFSTNLKPDKGVVASSLYRRDTKNPVWNGYLDLQTSVSDDDMLNILLFDFDSSSFGHDIIGVFRVKIGDLKPNSPVALTPDESKESLDYKYNKQAIKKGTRLILQRVTPAFNGTKKLFLIRHGESKWNKAQHEKHLHKMLAFDHALNMNGINQAKTLNGRIIEAAPNFQNHNANQDQDSKIENKFKFEISFFNNVQTVFTSPLTRASQTAIIGLNQLPIIKEKGITLLRTLREIKTIGGLDTVGKEVGHGIMKRVMSELAVEIGEDEAKKVFYYLINFYFFDFLIFFLFSSF